MTKAEEARAKELSEKLINYFSDETNKEEVEKLTDLIDEFSKKVVKVTAPKSNLKVVMTDYCGEPVAWGRDSLSKDEDLKPGESKECIQTGYDFGQSWKWVIVEKYLTREEAIEKYGPITDEPIGPRGGWKYVVFGDKKFYNRCMREGFCK